MLKEQHYITWHSESDGERGSAEYDDPSISALLLKNLKLIATSSDTAFILYFSLLSDVNILLKTQGKQFILRV